MITTVSHLLGLLRRLKNASEIAPWVARIAFILVWLGIPSWGSAQVGPPQISQGASGTVPATGDVAPATGTWDVLNNAGTSVASSVTPNGWTVSYSSLSFTVGVPQSAVAGDLYEVCYSPSSGPAESGTFDVISASISTAPGAPTNLTATGGVSQVALAWSGSYGAQTYNVLRSTSNGSGYSTVASGLTTGSYTDTQVFAYTTYYYVVTATNGYGTSSYSNQASATPGFVPFAPTNLTATAGNALVSLSWSASSRATSYSVFRSTTNGSDYTPIATGLASTAYLDAGVTNGNTYYYVVTASDQYGTSPYSNQASAEPFDDSYLIYSGYLVSYSGGSTNDGPFALAVDGFFPNGWAYSGASTCSGSVGGPITVTFTWVGSGAPPPALLIRVYTLALAWWGDRWPQPYPSIQSNSTVSDGFGDPSALIEDGTAEVDGQVSGMVVTDPIFGNGYLIPNYMVQANPGTEFSITLNPSASITAPSGTNPNGTGADCEINVWVTAAALQLGGATPQGDGWNIATGQQLTASLETTSAGQSVPFTLGAGESLSWGMPTLGSPFKDYKPSQYYAFKIPLSASDLTGPTFQCYFGATTSVSPAQIQCTLIDANKKPHPLPAANLNVLGAAPGYIASDIGSKYPPSFQFLNGSDVNATNPTSYLLSGGHLSGFESGFMHEDQVVDPANISTLPNPGGTWSYVQAIDSTWSFTSPSYIPFHAGPLNGLDSGNIAQIDSGEYYVQQYPGSYPYPYTNSNGVPQTSAPSNQTLANANMMHDSPGIGNLNTLPYTSYVFGSDFYDYLYYTPPVAASGLNTVPIPLANFGWSTGTVTAHAPSQVGGNWTGTMPTPVATPIGGGYISNYPTFPAWVAPPTNVSPGTASASGVTITWQAASSYPPGCTPAYFVYRSTAQGGPYTLPNPNNSQDPNNSTGITGLSYNDPSATAGTPYFYVVMVTLSAPPAATASSGYSVEAETGVLPAPSSFTAVNGSTSGTVNCSWAAVPNATSYQIAYQPVAGGTWTYKLGVLTTSYSWTGIPAGTYNFSICAVCDGKPGTNYPTPIQLVVP